MNSKGFASIGLLALLPLLIAVLALVSSAYFVLKNYGESRHACRVQLLDAQDSVAVDLKTLLSMNPGARVLRLKRTAAEAKVVATQLVPPANAVARAELAKVILQQTLYASRQRAVILRAQAKSRAAPWRAISRVREVLHTASNRQNPGGSGPSFTSSFRPGEFDVIPQPANSLTPDYEPSPAFSERQEIHVRWNFDLTSLLPGWAKPILGITNFRGTAECSATLRKDVKQWASILTRDKR